MKKIIILSLSLMVSLAHAGFGSEGVGGGDLCEDRIKIIRDDLAQWIKDGGPEGLILPSEINSEMYADLMLEQIALAQISCINAGDPGYPVNINGVPKVCRFELNKNGSQIICDYNKFQSIKDSEQYVLIHHEFAGLANIETPNGADSNYDISNQISGYLVSQVVKKLSVKPPLMATYSAIPGNKSYLFEYDLQDAINKAEIRREKEYKILEKNQPAIQRIIDKYKELLKNLEARTETIDEPLVKEKYKECQVAFKGQMDSFRRVYKEYTAEDYSQRIESEYQGILNLVDEYRSILNSTSLTLEQKIILLEASYDNIRFKLQRGSLAGNVAGWLKNGNAAVGSDRMDDCSYKKFLNMKTSEEFYDLDYYDGESSYYSTLSYSDLMSDRGLETLTYIIKNAPINVTRTTSWFGKGRSHRNGKDITIVIGYDSVLMGGRVFSPKYKTAFDVILNTKP